MTSTPTGTLITLESGGVTATIAPVGAALRGLIVSGIEVVPHYRLDVPAPACSGVVLVPWPNRIRDARWPGGQLAITEPARNNASHGLLRDTEYVVTQSDASSVTLAASVYPQLGYQFWLRTSVRYELGLDGVTVTHTITNAGEHRAPFGIGAHPFLTINDPHRRVTADELFVRIPAAEYYEVDERLLPTAVVPVDGSPVDLRTARPLSELKLDTGFRVGTAGFESTVSAEGIGTATLWQEPAFGNVQVYTRHDYPGANGPVPAIAIEPQTCATDAFNSGDGLRHLEPGETFTASWGIRFAR